MIREGFHFCLDPSRSRSVPMSIILSEIDVQQNNTQPSSWKVFCFLVYSEFHPLGIQAPDPHELKLSEFGNPSFFPSLPCESGTWNAVSGLWILSPAPFLTKLAPEQSRPLSDPLGTSPRSPPPISEDSGGNLQGFASGWGEPELFLFVHRFTFQFQGRWIHFVKKKKLIWSDRSSSVFPVSVLAILSYPRMEMPNNFLNVSSPSPPMIPPIPCSLIVFGKLVIIIYIFLLAFLPSTKVRSHQNPCF